MASYSVGLLMDKLCTVSCGILFTENRSLSVYGVCYSNNVLQSFHLKSIFHLRNKI